jgi:uncharacterized protein (TIGR02145 family)
MRLIFLLALTVLTASPFAQAPTLIPYQAIVRDVSGQPMISTPLTARFTIHDATANGPTLWQELQSVSTNALGLFTVQLGSIIELASVNWASGSKFMQVELDLGQGFIEIDNQELLSVPYALHAVNAPDEQQLSVSETGDTLFLDNGGFVIILGISAINNSGGVNIGTTAHTCGAQNVHNASLTNGSMTDQEGNIYKTVVIGTQEWMSENLNTSIYRNGDAIPTNLDDVTWRFTIGGAWAYYNNDASYACPFGKLYNWYACTDARQLCPVGWHVPSDAEWSILTTNLGGVAVAGGKIKTTGNINEATGLWHTPNTGATNSSGFSAAPGGYRGMSGLYSIIGLYGGWWSSSIDDSSCAIYRQLGYASGSADRQYSCFKQAGFSVRCLRD